MLVSDIKSVSAYHLESPAEHEAFLVFQQNRPSLFRFWQPVPFRYHNHGFLQCFQPEYAKRPCSQNCLTQRHEKVR